jgi:hypothetical protein
MAAVLFATLLHNVKAIMRWKGERERERGRLKEEG